MKAAFFTNREDLIQEVYGQGRREKIAEWTNLYPIRIDHQNFAQEKENLRDLEVIFSTWGMPSLSVEEIEAMPRLRALFYAAGSVQAFARPFLERGILVVSAWAGNAVPVAEFTLAQILLSCKLYFRDLRRCQRHETRITPSPFPPPRGVYGETVAILGAGMIGKKVIELLKPFRLRVIVFDPFLSEESARNLGVEKVSLEEAFQRAYVVSNHIANLPTTRRMLQGKHFASMRVNATFINTGRGATVAEDEMIEVLRKRPDLTALLDVTEPEPPLPDSPLYSLPNVFLSSHIAGAMGDERLRLADLILEEFLAWREGRPLRYAVTLKMLETMA